MEYYTNLTKSEFIARCTACGGNWSAMLMTGLRSQLPELFDAMPDVGYDFVTLCQLVNVVCTDNETDADQLMDAFKDGSCWDKEDHIYWTSCLLKAFGICTDERDAELLAFLWMFKYICIRSDVDNRQLKATVNYLAGFEDCLENDNRYSC